MYFDGVSSLPAEEGGEKCEAFVVGEVYFKVNHCLLALPGQELKDIERAMSHPQALAQCDGYLTVGREHDVRSTLNTHRL